MTAKNNRVKRVVVHPVDSVRQVVKSRLKEAGRIIRMERLPHELNQLAGDVGSWPAVIHGRWDIGAWSRMKVRRSPPGGREIDRMHEVLGWLLWLEADHRRVVFGVMVSSLRKVAAVDPQRRSHVAIQKAYEQAITYILCRLLVEPTK